MGDLDDELLASHGLGDYRDRIRAIREPCRRGRVARKTEPWQSSFGGRPRVENEFVWPRLGNRPLNFIAELACADLGLPIEGALLLFHDETHWGLVGDPRGFAVVIHRRAARELLEATPPTGERRALFGLLRIPERPHEHERTGIIFEPGYSYPEDPGAAIPPSAGAAYETFHSSISGTMQAGGIGTPANATHEDVIRVCAAAMKTGPETKWSLLLQAFDGEIAGWNWGDAGSLSWMVPTVDLARGDFSRLWVVLGSL